MIKKLICSTLISSLVLFGFSTIAICNTFEENDPINKITPSSKFDRFKILVRMTSGVVEKMEGERWVNLKKGDMLKNKDIIRTGKNGTVILELPELSGFIRILPNSELTLEKVIIHPDAGGQVMEVNINKGSILTKLRKFNRKTSVYKINTKGASVAVRGTIFLTTFDNKDETRVIVADGKVNVYAEGKEVEINKKQSTKVPLGGVPEDPKNIPTSIDLTFKNITQVNGNIRISGKSEEDSFLTINNTPYSLYNNGEFEEVLNLSYGENNLDFKVETIDGRQILKHIKVYKLGPEK